MWGWVFLALTWVFITQVSDDWKQMNWSMQCKDVEPEVRVVYKIPEPHMIVETTEKETCYNGECKTHVSRNVQSVNGKTYPLVTDDTPVTSILLDKHK